MLTKPENGIIKPPGVNGGSSGMAKSTQRQSLPEQDRKTARALLQATQPFRDLRATMPLQYVTTFLLVCEEEGLSVGDYAERAGVSKSVMSRHILDIGDRDRYMEEGFGLVTTRSDPLELRKKQVLLTDKGRALAHKLSRAMTP